MLILELRMWRKSLFQFFCRYSWVVGFLLPISYLVSVLVGAVSFSPVPTCGLKSLSQRMVPKRSCALSLACSPWNVLCHELKWVKQSFWEDRRGFFFLMVPGHRFCSWNLYALKRRWIFFVLDPRTLLSPWRIENFPLVHFCSAWCSSFHLSELQIQTKIICCFSECNLGRIITPDPPIWFCLVLDCSYSVQSNCAWHHSDLACDLVTGNTHSLIR